LRKASLYELRDAQSLATFVRGSRFVRVEQVGGYNAVATFYLITLVNLFN